MNAHASPGFAAFRPAYEQGRGSLVWRKTVADLETPVAAFLKLGHGHTNAFLLESVEGGAARGRYSIIGMEPDIVWRCQNGVASINRHALSAPHAFVEERKAPLDSLRDLIAETRLDVPAHLPPMAGGLVGYLGYDMVRQMEKLPNKNKDTIGVPEGIMLRPTLFAIFDNVNDELSLVTPVYPAGDVSVEAAWERAQRRLDEAKAALQRPLPHQPPPVMLPDPPAPSSNFTKEAFLAGVARCKEYVAAGDAFQIVGSSPEVLVRLRDGMVTIRPLAGTRRRGATHEEDQALEAELLGDPKERAEHLMLLDLGRNDVGRVSAVGTVKVTESFVIERFSHVMHISSNVEGKLRDGLDAVDALIGGFPAGTLSGAPKVRAMEIIEELEPDRRGIYAGCIGYFAANGTMDTCIGLRTALVKDGVMYVQAGAGIVADSVAEAEYEECRQKARALVRAAEEAVRFAAGKTGGNS